MNCEDGVGSELGFVIGAVKFQHGPVEFRLIVDVHADERRCDYVVDVGDCVEYAFAEVTVLSPSRNSTAS